MARRKFTLDRRSGKLMGVCAGIGRYFNIDPTFVRIGAVVVTLLGAFPWTLVAYGLAAWLAKPRGYDAEDYSTVGKLSTNDLRLNMRDIDRRMAEVEQFVTNSNSSLASEIEKLR
ncbi:MAG TPA: PspC domain-containing protein [Allosphingosinicella sp.]|nr:PspC domain-containing protein [Allosphingosinicella sp.]